MAPVANVAVYVALQCRGNEPSQLRSARLTHCRGHAPTVLHKGKRVCWVTEATLWERANARRREHRGPHSMWDCAVVTPCMMHVTIGGFDC